MYNPLVDGFGQLSDAEVELKVTELSRKYFQSNSNPALQQQVGSVLNMFQEEARARRAKAQMSDNDKNGNNSLDNLINIS
jgi:ATP-dependent protease HslVU (ClpYQ) ATPase subunit